MEREKETERESDGEKVAKSERGRMKMRIGLSDECDVRCPTLAIPPSRRLLLYFLLLELIGAIQLEGSANRTY